MSSLSVHFDSTGAGGPNHSKIQAVDDVSFQIAHGRSFGLVGESGSGKSTIARAVLGLVNPTSGSVRVMGEDLSTLRGRDKRHMYRFMQFVAQDPYASLNPKMRVEQIVAEPLTVHRLIRTKQQRKDRVADLLNLVGLDNSYISRYPSQLSGGERQRVAIARAISIEPKFIVCDEPTSALDVSITVQILELLRTLKRLQDISLLFISHDLATVAAISDDVAVVYAGQIVESGPTAQVFNDPRHPYTKALVSSVPVPDPDVERNRPRLTVSGEPPSAAGFPSGCRFHPRCPFSRGDCALESPPLLGIENQRTVACLFWDRLLGPES